MPHATSDFVAAPVAAHEITRHLTESILTLQQTIRNIRDDVENGIAPSILMPAEPSQDINTGMVLLTLEPSAKDIELHLTPLSQRLAVLEEKLCKRNQWHPPSSPPKSPEYSIIDIADLSSAIALLETLLLKNSPKPLSPQPYFSKYTWTWDPSWKEFYTHETNQSSYTYLSRWRLNEARQVWEHISMNGANLLPDSAAEMLGSWDDWMWDEVVGEWYLDVSEEDEKCCVFASRWEVQENGEWVYVGRIGNQV